MNIVQLTPQQSKDYRSAMQGEAAAFIDRYQAQHLDDDSLFERTVRHLVLGRNVPVFMADRLVHLAMSVRLPAGAVWVGVDMASGQDETVVLLRDYRTNRTVSVPRRVMPQRYQLPFLEQLGTPATLAIPY